MIEICSEPSGKIVITEDGEILLKSSSLPTISEYLNEERPEEVEAHIFSGNSFNFDMETREKEMLKELIFQQFRKENDNYFSDGD
ncbi:MAG TPA: hypothetical protein VFD51_01975 [Patescibacteria group bacterium]|nr:hypothetical protein [Patescibacteria group bacterium]